MTPEQIEAIYDDEEPSRAEALLKPLAEAGDPVAQLYMGHLCDPRDQQAAVAWYRKSSSSGYHEGTHYLASFLYHGFGADQNVDEALRLFVLAAEAGNEGSQWKLGQHYLSQHHSGVPGCRDQAVKWLKLSASQGHGAARDLLEVATMDDERKRDTPASFQALVGLRLSIQRNAGDTLVLHFGTIRSHRSGKGTVGDFALHISCPWRLDGSMETTVTGSDDRWEYAGPGERPSDWDRENGQSVQQARLDGTFGAQQGRIGRVIDHEEFVVVSAEHGSRGDVKLEFSNGYSLSLFPASYEQEAWRFFAPGSDHHLVFPPD